VGNTELMNANGPGELGWQRWTEQTGSDAVPAPTQRYVQIHW